MAYLRGFSADRRGGCRFVSAKVVSSIYHDDYGVILTFANEYSQLHGFTAKVLDITTTRNNDYNLFCIASIAMAASLCIASDAVAYIRLGQRQRLVLSGIENYRSNPETNSPQMDPEIRASAPERR